MGTGAERRVQKYRVQGFSCANCANQFEENVKRLASVRDAKVNFNTSSITVDGWPTKEELKRAGAFENLHVYADDEQMTTRSLWKNTATLRTLLSGILLLLGWTLHVMHGEGAMLPLSAFAASIVIGGYALFLQGIRNVFVLRFDMKTLMTVAVLGAAAIGEWGEGATVVFLFAISEALETYSMDKARQSIRSLMNITPKKALIRRQGEEITVSVDDVQIGDTMIVKPGQKIAMDGVVTNGRTTVNEAAITGESIPKAKQQGDDVYAGTFNEEGYMEVDVTKRVEDTTIAKIIHLVEEAQAERAPAQAFVDRFARYYTPTVMAIAFVVVIVPPLFFGGVWQDWIYRGLAMLVVACPCALVISTPVSIVTAIGTAARNGVLVKGGAYLEATGALSAIAFDKTGTLTRGIPEVTDVRTVPEQFVDQSIEKSVEQSDNDGLEGNAPDEWLHIAAAIEQHSQHPLAAAIVRHVENKTFTSERYNMDDFHSVTGRGVQASVNGRIYYVGSPGWFTEDLDTPLSDGIQTCIVDWQNEGKTVTLVGRAADRPEFGLHIVGLIAIRDEVRQSSHAMIQQLHELGIRKTVMLTGDNVRTAKAIGKQLGITDVKSELLPEQKLTIIRQLKRNHNVAMVGDGVNDAPALANATVGMAMGGVGTDTALETADIAFMADDLTKLPFIVKLSRRTLRIIKQNIAASLLLKVAALLLIVPGWLTLWMAIFADMGATLLVTFNGLRLLRMKNKS